MGEAQLSRDEIERRKAVLLEAETLTEAASKLGLDPRGLKRWYERSAARGDFGTDPVIPGFVINKVTTVKDEFGDTKREFIQQVPQPGEEFEMPEGQTLKRISALVDSNGHLKQQWVLTKPIEEDPVAMAEKIKEVFKDVEFKLPNITQPTDYHHSHLNLFCLPDLHMGLYCWGEELEGENWNLAKARDVYTNSFTQLVGCTSRADTAVILLGGDQIHSDSSKNATPNSGHSLDVDGRYERVVQETCHMCADMVMAALQTHRHVLVRVLKGNHDPHASAAVAFFLQALFMNEDRVTVDVSPNLFWAYKWGKTMLFSTHGHTTKPAKMPGIMAARWPEMWGATKFRYGHTFHVHHREKFMEEDAGAIIETHQSPAPGDSYNYGHGYCSGRSLRSITYHKELGECGTMARPILPDLSR